MTTDVTGMVRNRAKLRVLLLQIREDEETRWEEFEGFVRLSGLAGAQFVSLNVYKDPVFDCTVVEGFDALFIGGSSDATVTRPDLYPFVYGAIELILHCDARNLPVFASCFGFQLAIEAFGGRVEVDHARSEFGTARIDFHPASLATDPLLQDGPRSLWAVVGHKERAVVLPPGVELLASTALCPYHAFRRVGRPFYAFQFHPEMNRQDLTSRLSRYRSRYLENDEQYERIVAGLNDTDEANQLIARFIDRIVLG